VREPVNGFEPLNTSITSTEPAAQSWQDAAEAGPAQVERVRHVLQAALAPDQADDLSHRQHAGEMHGGIGFTWEHGAHLYFKRAKSSELFLGDASYHRERPAARIGL
jgi:alkylation response protein AidB-like acyl-CoA dehydrogenase